MTTAGCPRDATNEDSKTANTRETAPSLRLRLPLRLHSVVTLLTLAVLMGSWGGCALAAPYTHTDAAATPTPTPTTAPANRTRLHKRHNLSSFRESFQHELNASAMDLDWANACGGSWIPKLETELQAERRRKAANRCGSRKKLLRILQNNTGRELRQLQDDNKVRKQATSVTSSDSTSTQAIDISTMDKWMLYNDFYSFLPRLNGSSSSGQVVLRHWHRELQVFVAAFSYLRHDQLHWDYVNLLKQSALSAELQRLRKSARSVLCQVETAINGTERLYGQRKRTSRSPRLRTVPRAQMEQRLRGFKTPLVRLHKEALAAARQLPAEQPAQPIEVDMIFLKHQYIEYLRQMTHRLAKQRSKMCLPTTSEKLSSKPKAKPQSKPKQKARRRRPKKLTKPSTEA